MHRLLLKALLVVLLLALPTIIGTGDAPAADTNSIRLPPVKAGRTRPLIAIAADNAGTETTDLIVPYGVLKEADIANVVIVSTHAGAVSLMPALTIKPDTTMHAFDTAHPSGADIVIVPALHNSRNEVVVDWVREQSDKGATIVSICEGAWIAARAGILVGRAATTHWYAFDEISRRFPGTHWVRDQRYVFDHNVMTTTGVTASIPASLALVEAMAGHAKAKAVAAVLGIKTWTPAHDAAPFHLTTRRMWLVARNFLSFWGHETLSIPITNGFDEIALALTADAWSRTYRSQAIAAPSGSLIQSRHGLVLMPDGDVETRDLQLALLHAPSGKALDHALEEIATRYGKATADLVALQLEYARN
ncbi:DJ-1/PfpI family protein [Pseudaminobacter soli (ex Li et al. 2025)]|uniref:Thiamine biosynthesis protein ThiJ n=1 Tax=Pseudaminobacter soli (ex Li et al. 2025) TaxID=1295366 RepID=A0A2P7SCA5_9HYPH|nr:DJ-1/PfpI family protein [Mesorhizobium soli]PSJ60162.1 thiamine biosynthesis protein ThiJ [Mesorhizobium soli]